MIAWRRATTIEIGSITRPMPRKRPGRLRYIRSDVKRICPQARRRARRRGADGLHVARESEQETSAISAARRPMTSGGFSSAR